MKLKFEEAISVPEAKRRLVADSIDYHSIGNILISIIITITTVIIIIIADSNVIAVFLFF